MLTVNRRLFGRRYSVPNTVCTALEWVFDASVEAVNVVEHSRYARMHLGMSATTRTNHILLAISGDEFVSSPELLLHEYFHVLRQWNVGRLTRFGYLMESVRCGYRDNRFEREARDFAALNIERYRRFLEPDHCTPRGHRL